MTLIWGIFFKINIKYLGFRTDAKNSYHRQNFNVHHGINLGQSIKNTKFSCLFWCSNDITVSRFNPCPVLPRPFVGALSSRLGEEGRIMQRNNGAPLCQLAPIRRTHRLCQNRRRPNCFSMPLTWEGVELYKRPQYSTSCHSTARCVKRLGGGGEGNVWGI